ncbi:MAG: hypothetical protein AB7O24_17050 [Kofleriaceae bacterium]
MLATFARTSPLVIGFAWFACTTNAGEPPTISNLTFSPTSWVVGEQIALNASLSFHDPDGDVSELGFELRLPSGAIQPSAPPIQGTLGQFDAGMSLAIVVVPPEPGPYSFELWVIDDAANESNRLLGTANAQ